MTIDEVHELFAYNAWATARTFAALRALPPGTADAGAPSSFPTIRATLAHMAGAEWIWLQRWLGVSPTVPPPWYEATLDEVEAALATVASDRERYIAGLGDVDLSRVIHYRTFAGDPHATPLGDLFRHVVNHASYHRGQVATQMRQLGFAPPATDMIVFFRARQA